MANFRRIEDPRLLTSLIVIANDCGDARSVLMAHLGQPTVGSLTRHDDWMAYWEALAEQQERRELRAALKRCVVQP